jgi:hypothetical protein
MNAWRAPRGFESRVLKILHHDAVVAAPVPCVRIVGTRAEMVPQGLRRCVTRLRRYSIVQDDVTVFIPEGEVVSAEDRRAGFDRRKMARGFLRHVTAGDGGIDARDALRRNTAGGGDDPSLELLETRRLGEITDRLFEA